MTEKLLEAARQLYATGIVVLPAIKAQKRPVGAWKKWTAERPDFDAVFRPGLNFDAPFPTTAEAAAKFAKKVEVGEEPARRCETCANWNDYGLEDVSGFCWTKNEERSGLDSVCVESYEERKKDEEVPF